MEWLWGLNKEHGALGKKEINWPKDKMLLAYAVKMIFQLCDALHCKRTDVWHLSYSGSHSWGWNNNFFEGQIIENPEY